MWQPGGPPITFEHVSDLLAPFADYPLDRIRITTDLGRAGRRDIDLFCAQKVACEIVDGVVIDHAGSLTVVPVELRLTQALDRDAERDDHGFVLSRHTAVVTARDSIRVPMVAFFRRRGPAPPGGPTDIVPDFVADVVCPTNTPTELFDNRWDYFAAGVSLFWYVHPKQRTVEVYTAVDQLTTLTEADTLDGGAVLPGFTLPVADLFSAARFGDAPPG